MKNLTTALFISFFCIAMDLFPAFANDRICVGTLLCLSGNCADWGLAALKGAQLAAKEVNQLGGIMGKPLELLVEDTRESISGAQAVTAFEKLTSVSGVKLFIGPSWSPGALAIDPLVARRKEFLAITPSASAEGFSEAGENLFNMRPPERLATEQLAKYAIRMKWKRGAVFTSSQAAEMTQGQIFRDSFVNGGGEIVKYLESNPVSAEVRMEALQIIRSKPDVVFLMAYNQMLSAVSNLRQLGFKGPLLLISVDEARIEAAHGLLEGSIVARALPPSSEFVRKFEQEYNERPGLSAENGYDSVMALSKGIEAAQSINAAAVASKLPYVRFEGASVT